MSISETNLEIRRTTYGQIRSICSLPASDSEKLARCINASSIYTAMTGDDSLTPPELIAERQTQIDSLPSILKIADRKQKQKQLGIKELF